MQMTRVKVLRTVPVAADDRGIRTREIRAGTVDEIPADVFAGLKAEGYVDEIDPLDHDKDGKKGGSESAGAGDHVMTAAELLAAAEADPPMEFFTLKAEAAKILGDDVPAKKADILAALRKLASESDAAR